MKQVDFVLPINKTKTFLKRGYDKYCDTALEIIQDTYKVDVASSSKSKFEKAWIDAVLIRDGEVKACVEVKSRNMNFEKLKSLNSYMISADKINKGVMIASKAFECPFIVFVVLIPDKRMFYWKISDEKGNLLMPITTKSQKTPFNCAGGERIENVSYLPLSKMQEVYYEAADYFTT